MAELLRVLAPPILLIVAVLGAILIGVATPTESAAVGAGGALVLAMSKKTLTAESFFAAMQQATRITCMVFIIFVGANIFALVFAVLAATRLFTKCFRHCPADCWALLLR